MKRTKLTKIIAVISCMAMMSVCFTGCGKDTVTNDEETYESTVESETVESSVEDTAETATSEESVEVASDGIVIKEMPVDVPEIEDAAITGIDRNNIDFTINVPMEISEDKMETWANYVDKMVTAYEALDELKKDPLALVCLNDFKDETNAVAEYVEIPVMENYEPYHYSEYALCKYLDLYVNRGEHDLSFSEILENVTDEEVAAYWEADTQYMNGAVYSLYFGFDDGENVYDSWFSPEFNDYGDITPYSGKADSLGRSWDYTATADDEAEWWYGHEYLYSFFDHDNNLGFLWLFDHNGDLVDVNAPVIG